MKKKSISLFLAVILAGCMSYVPGQQSYWDTQVKEMCAKDGGLHIIERVRIAKSEMNFLGKNNGKLSVLVKELAHPKSPVYAIRDEGKVFASEGNASIGRVNWSIVRRSDQKVVATLIRYSRTGGDFPEFIHQSTFFCPSSEKISNDMQDLFLIDGDSK